MMKRMILLVGAIIIAVISCGSLDVEKSKIREIREENNSRGESIRVRYIVPEDVERQMFDSHVADTNVIIKTEQVIIPVNETTRQPLTPLQSTQRAANNTIASPQTFIGGTQFYEYDEYKQFPIVTRPLALTTILLESGEVPIGVPYMSDTLRWEMTGDVWRTTDGREIQMIMIKPLETGLQTNMVVATNKRIYQFLLTSTRDSYMPMVRFRYPLNEMQGRFITASTLRQNQNDPGRNINTNITRDTDEFLSFNYRITAGWWLTGLFRPDWTPVEAWDNGRQTFIRLPRGVLMREFPVVFEERNYIVNYRIEDTVMILDKLVRKATLRLDGKRVIVEKMRGEPRDIRRLVRNDIEVVGDMPPLRNSVQFDIRGEVPWAPTRVVEYDRETHLFFAEDAFDINAVIQIIDENRNSVEFRRVGNLITIPRVIRTIQIAYDNRILTIQRRS